MSLDDAQQQWQSHNHGKLMTIDVDLLFKEVRRNQFAMEAAVFRRDCVEVTLGLFMACFYGYGAIYWGKPAWGVTALGCLFVAIFLSVDRRIQRRRRPACDSTLASCIQSSMSVVRHQIWLLRNVFWWYLLPLWIGLVAFTASNGDSAAIHLFSLVGAMPICTLVFWWIYRGNQSTVQRVLIPRCDELQAMQASLDQAD